MKSFTFESQQSRVIFGAGCLAQLPFEVERLGAKRVMLVATPGRSTLSSRARDLLTDVIVVSFDGAEVHLPQDIALAARDAASSSRAAVS